MSEKVRKITGVGNSPRILKPASRVTNEIVNETRLSNIEDRLRLVQDMLARLQTSVTAFPEATLPDALTVNQAARLLERRPYTVREWCRLGRINAHRALSGRGPYSDWRISREEISRIRAEGLLPLTTSLPRRSAGR